MQPLSPVVRGLLPALATLVFLAASCSSDPNDSGVEIDLTGSMTCTEFLEMDETQQTKYVFEESALVLALQSPSGTPDVDETTLFVEQRCERQPESPVRAIVAALLTGNAD